MSEGPRQGMRPAFRRWRAARPFWGGLLLALGGAEILVTEKASLKVMLHTGAQGLAGYLLPTLMLVLGLLILFNPAQRLFYSITGVLLSLGTWVTSNLGGFFIGLLLGVAGELPGLRLASRPGTAAEPHDSGAGRRARRRRPWTKLPRVCPADHAADAGQQ